VNSFEDRVSAALDKIFDEQERLALAAVNSDVSKSILAAGVSAGVENIITSADLRQVSEKLLPLMQDIYRKAVEDTVEEGYGSEVSEPTETAAGSQQIVVVNNFNDTTQEEIKSALTTAAVLTDGDGGDVDVALKLALAYSLIKSIFNKLRASRKNLILETAVYGSYNQGLFDAAVANEVATSRTLMKQWVSMLDGKVRDSHRALHGDKVQVGAPFFVNGVAIRFPKDPLAPPNLTIGCRCVLKFSIN